MFYQYGLFKPLVNKKINHPATIRQFIPLLFVLGLIIGLPLAFVHPVLGILYACGVGLYLLAVISIGIQYRNKYLPLVFATIHFCYGWGYLCGIGKVLFKRSFNVETNR